MKPKSLDLATIEKEAKELPGQAPYFIVAADVLALVAENRRLEAEVAALSKDAMKNADLDALDHRAQFANTLFTASDVLKLVAECRRLREDVDRLVTQEAQWRALIATEETFGIQRICLKVQRDRALRAEAHAKALEEKLAEVREAMSKCVALAGHPNAALACYNILSVLQEVVPERG